MLFSVIIPSRLAPIDRDQPDGRWFLERSLDSVLHQSVVARGHHLEVIVGVDAGNGDRARERIGNQAHIVEGQFQSQAHALNAAAQHIRGDAVAIIEDDDLWSEYYLEFALKAFGQSAFVSSTQLDVRPNGVIARISDYPTPTTWVMPRATWEAVGGFDPDYRWHLDADWLGRLSDLRIKRTHFVEMTAPIEPLDIHEVRPNLARLANFGLRMGQQMVTFARHLSPMPLVTRTVHPDSGTARIRTNPQIFAASEGELGLLRDRFGSVPW